MTEGKTTIAPEVLQSIARLTTLQVNGVSRIFSPYPKMNQLFKRGASEGVQIDVRTDTVFTDIYVVMKHDVNVREVSLTIQQDVARAISEMVGMKVGSVNIHIEDVDYPENNAG